MRSVKAYFSAVSLCFVLQAVAMAISTTSHHPAQIAETELHRFRGGGNCYQSFLTGLCTGCTEPCGGPGTCPEDEGYELTQYLQAQGGLDDGVQSQEPFPVTCERFHCSATCEEVLDDNGEDAWICSLSAFSIQNDNKTGSDEAGNEDPGA